MENGHSAIMENGHNDNNVENGHNANVENGHNANLENGHTANIQNGHQEPGPMLCLSMCAYRKEGMDEEEYRKYMTENHAPLVRGLMVKYGIDKYSMVSTMTLLQTSNHRHRKNPHTNLLTCSFLEYHIGFVKNQK